MPDALIHQMPPAAPTNGRPKPPDVPPRAARAEWCTPLPTSALRAYVDDALALLRLTGRPLPWAAAVADYVLETDGGQGERRELDARAARWGWAVDRSTMSRRMRRLREDAADWRSMYAEQRGGAGDGRAIGAQPDATDVQRKGPASRRSGRFTQSRATLVQRRRNRPTSSPPRATDTNTNPGVGEAREGARAREGRAVEMAELPAKVLRYRRQIEARLSADELGRRQAAYQALRAGPMPAGDVVRLLDEAEARAGPVAVAAALTVTANDAHAPYHPERIKHFQSTLDTILDHVQRTRIGTDEPDPAAEAGGAGGANGARGGGRGAGDVRGTAAERATVRSIAGTHELLARHRASRDGPPGDAPAPDGGRPDGGGEPGGVPGGDGAGDAG